jgi:phosphatidylserine decarboxylase
MAHGISESIRRAAVPIHPAGRPFIAVFLIATVALYLIWAPLGFVGLVLTGWCTLFFRDPKRVTPVAPGLAVSPADGRVATVDEAVPPPEIGLGEAPLPRISVFMSVFDVHVNRAPLAGRVERVEHRPGLFLNAEDPAASADNERLSLLLATASGPVGVVQIAGLVARRIVGFVKAGDTVAAGGRIGLIRFGSRVDVYLPAGARPLVAVGQRAIAGETPLADLAGERPAIGETRID